MKYDTIKLIHDLLEAHADDLEESEGEARRVFEEALNRYELESENSWQPGGSDELDTLYARKNRASKRASEAREALLDFEGHDWH